MKGHWKNSLTAEVAESGDLCGYEGGRRGPSHPEKADPGLASGDIELSTPQGGTTNKVAKVNSYGSFGLGVELSGDEPMARTSMRVLTRLQ